MQLASVNEGLLPFKVDDDAIEAATLAQRLEEERRLMYVGITRARHTLVVSTLRRRKRGRDTVAGVPSRFIAEMKLDEGVVKEDARERLKRVRAELAAKSDARCCGRHRRTRLPIEAQHLPALAQRGRFEPRVGVHHHRAGAPRSAAAGR